MAPLHLGLTGASASHNPVFVLGALVSILHEQHTPATLLSTDIQYYSMLPGCYTSAYLQPLYHCCQLQQWVESLVLY